MLFRPGVWFSILSAMRKNWFEGNIYLVLAYRFLLAMVLFTLCRLGFFIFNNAMFPGMTAGRFVQILKGGIVFDLSALAYINILVILMHIVPFDFRFRKGYQDAVKYIFFVLNGFAVSVNCMDFVYYRFVFKRATSDVFGTFENENNLVKLFFSFVIDYWPAVLFNIFLWVLMAFLYNRVKPVNRGQGNRIVRWALAIIMIPVSIGLVIGAARGGFRHSTRPITISNAAKYVEAPADVAIVLNTPFSLLRTSGKKALVRHNYFDEEKLKSLYDPHFIPYIKKDFSGENVVIIILESFAREYIGALNQDLEGGTYKGYTPFLDSLISESMTFDVSLANGKKSIDAMPSILASVPSLETPYVISHYANNSINALPSLLKDKGYYSAFFHGAPNGSMGFDSFARMAGFDDYFGMNEYPDKNDFDGMWGVWDEPFLKFFAKKMDSFRQPFLASVFTVSSHHPFMVPAGYEGRFPKGPAPILEVIGYSDNALRKFFSKVSKSQWYQNTLFVITADHTNESVHKEYQNNFGAYSIPIIFFRPGSEMKGTVKRIAQQIDIMPSVLSYLGYDREYVAFGNNLFDNLGESFAFNTNGSTYHLFMKDHLLEMVEGKAIALHNYKTDRFFQTNLLDVQSTIAAEMSDKLKAIIQTYNARLIDNDMTIRK